MSAQDPVAKNDDDQKSEPGVDPRAVFDVANPRPATLTRVRVANPASDKVGKICCDGPAHDFNAAGAKVVPDQIFAKMYRANVSDNQIPDNPTNVSGKTAGRVADPVNGGFVFRKAYGQEIADAYGQIQLPPLVQPPHDANNKLAVWIHFAHNNLWHKRIVAGFYGQSNVRNQCNEM